MSSAIVSFEPQNLQEGLALAEQMAKSALIPDALRGKPADVLIVLMTARELGIGPMQALRGMSVLKGKVVMEAALVVAQVMRHRDVCEYFRVVESTDVRAAYETKRVGSEPVKMCFTIEQAKQAGLAGKDNWRTFPAAMLRARCSMHLARAAYPDLVLGIYDPDELGAQPPSAAPTPAERDVTPSAAPSPTPPKTAADAKAQLAAKLAERQAVAEGEVVEPTPKPRMVIIDEAKPHPWERIKAAGASSGMSAESAFEAAKRICGKGARKDFTGDDAAAFARWLEDEPAANVAAAAVEADIPA